MRKIILASIMVFILIVSVGLVVAAKKQNNEFSLPENAVVVSPGVFYIGEAMDKGRAVKGYAFIHYAKGFEPEVSDVEPSYCYEFIWEGRKWNNVEPYLINPTNDFGLDEEGILATFETSVSTWGNVGYDIIGEGELAYIRTNVRRLDGKNTVGFKNLRRGVIAMNIIWTDGSNLVEWDQIYSNRFDWSLEGEEGKMDFQNIATHELGHAVGLADLYPDSHPLCSEQTMWGYSTEGETKKRTLESGDIAGIQALYG